MAAATTVTVAAPDLVGSACAVADAETVAGLGTDEGAVYTPAGEMAPTVLLPPATPATLQFTAVLLAPVTVAVNCWVLLTGTLAAAGETLTAIGGVLEELPPHETSSSKQPNANQLCGREKVR